MEGLRSGELFHHGAQGILLGGGELPAKLRQDLNFLDRVDAQVSFYGRIQGQHFDRVAGASGDDTQKICGEIACG